MLNATVLTDRFDRALLYATHVHGGQVRKGTSIPDVGASPRSRRDRTEDGGFSAPHGGLLPFCTTL